MLVLAVDTSTAAVTAGLVRLPELGASELLAQHVTVDARRHGELLSPAIQDALAEAEVSPTDLDAVVAGIGPGPFTGLRVGLVTAAALADALGIPSYGVCSLDAIAARAGAEPPFLVASDARRKEIYWAAYPTTAAADRQGPHVNRPSDVDTSGFRAAAGAGAKLYADVLGLPVVEPLYPHVEALVEVARDRIRGRAPGEALTPLYLRRPDAVEAAARKSVLQ